MAKNYGVLYSLESRNYFEIDGIEGFLDGPTLPQLDWARYNRSSINNNTKKVAEEQSQQWHNRPVHWPPSSFDCARSQSTDGRI